jgi:stage III sporulation protein SpoIIIAA
MKMTKIELKFIRPSAINANVDETAQNWLYDEIEENQLEIDLESLTIECPQNGVSKIITDWVINENSYSMLLKKEQKEGYSEITPQFCISMIGQLLKQVNSIKPLQAYIELIFTTFEVARPADKPNVDSNDNDDSYKNL